MILEVAPGVFLVDNSGGEISLIRDKSHNLLWHVCKKTPDPDPTVPVELCECGLVIWDLVLGTYRCEQCMMKLNSEDVLSDGLGTGTEGNA